MAALATNVKGLMEERKGLVSRLEALASKRELSPEEQAAWDALTAQVAELDSRVSDLEDAVGADTEEDMAEGEDPAAEPAATAPLENEQNARKLAAMEARLKDLETKTTRRTRPVKPAAAPAYVRDLNDRQAREDADLSIRGWALVPTGLVQDRHRAAAERSGFDLNCKVLNLRLRSDIETRAQSVATNSAGGFLVPTGFIPELEKNLAYYANLREVSRVIRTSEGNPIQVPTVDDTTQTGERVAENVAYTAQDVTFGQKTLNAYKYTSKLVNASIELVQDSAIDVQGMLGGLLGERIGRIQQTEFTTGTGSSQPEGCVTSAAAGATAASATAIAVDDLLNLVHSLDRAFRDNARFMMHDSILLAIRKLKDSQGRPVFTESYIQGEPDRLLGYPVTINNAMVSTLAATNRSVLFGDFQKGFFIRDALDLQVVRLDERYAELGQVAFVALMRSDSKVVLANAIRRLTH